MSENTQTSEKPKVNETVSSPLTSKKTLTEAEKRAILRERRRKRVLQRGDEFLKNPFVTPTRTQEDIRKKVLVSNTEENVQPTKEQSTKEQSSPEGPITPSTPITPIIPHSPNIPQLNLKESSPQTEQNVEESRESTTFELPKGKQASPFIKSLSSTISKFRGYIMMLLCLFLFIQREIMNCRQEGNCILPIQAFITTEILIALPIIIEYLQTTSFGLESLDLLLYGLTILNTLRSFIQDFSRFILLYITVSCIYSIAINLSF